MQLGRPWVAVAVVVAALCGLPLQAPAQTALTRAQALAALEQPLALKRAEAIARLAEIGTMPDTERLARRLADDDEHVRTLANLALWQIWGRSGDPAIDALFKRGVEQMEAADFDEALATFTDIIRRKPAFAEGWNKRATILFLLGQLEASLHDCREVLKRNALHYGALSGMGQIYLQLGELDQALVHFQRALKVNPHLPGAAEAVRLIEQHQTGSRRLTT
jgi:tetratricopeptide (TPR) repeat protein